MEVRANDKCQTASGGSYVAKYLAEVEVCPGRGIASLEVVNTLPDPPDPELLQLTLNHIRRGAESVLSANGMNARLKLHDLVIHDVDCKPARYEQLTVEAFTRAISTNA
jgi:hypothetical protein